MHLNNLFSKFDHCIKKLPSPLLCMTTTQNIAEIYKTTHCLYTTDTVEMIFYLSPCFLLFNEKIQINKFFFRDFQQISMSLVKIGQNK